VETPIKIAAIWYQEWVPPITAEGKRW